MDNRKEPYERPTLQVRGTVSELTQAKVSPGPDGFTFSFTS